MDNLKIFCMCLDNDYLNVVKELGYVPVGLKNDNFSKEWLRDNTNINISKKNSFYGEYTFYYWYWKNELKNKPKNQWIGFCSYRELWGSKNESKDDNNLKKILLQKKYDEWDEYDAVIGKPLFLKKTNLIKVLKYGKLAAIKSPKNLFLKNSTIKFHFDMFHGVGNLESAIKLLPSKDKIDFYNFVNNEVSFNQGNMFISKSEDVINSYFSDVFSWLEKCEKIFGFTLKDYNRIRMYTFLAERYLSFWFKKYTKYLEWPIIYRDIKK
tara:strand:+ start:215 stop:1015 length:801 start_codon:yes stop_codon:yes gene_type:complete